VSFANELSEPIPILIVAVLGIGSIFLSFAFPTKEELDQMTADFEKDLEIQR